MRQDLWKRKKGGETQPRENQGQGDLKTFLRPDPGQGANDAPRVGKESFQGKTERKKRRGKREEGGHQSPGEKKAEKMEKDEPPKARERQRAGGI